MSAGRNLRRDSGDSAPAVVDDRSSRIAWFGDWAGLLTGNAAITDGTLKELNAPGGGFFFEFTGTLIQVIGVVRPLQDDKPYVATTSTYSIDGKELGTFTSPNVTQEVDNTLFFSSGSLPVDSHQLFVSVDSASLDYPYLLDDLIFIPAPTVNPDITPLATSLSSPSSPTPSSISSSSSSSSSISFSASSSSASSTSSRSLPSQSLSAPSSTSLTSPTTRSSLLSSSSSVPSASSATWSSPSSSQINATLPSTATTCTSLLSSPAPEPTAAPQSNVATSNKSHVGPIVGSVIGGAFLSAFLFGLLLCCLKRNRAHPSGSTVEGSAGYMSPQGISGITPYLLPRDYRHSPTNSAAAEQPQFAVSGPEGYHASNSKVSSPDARRSNTMFPGEVPGRGSPSYPLQGPSGGGALSEVSSASGSLGAASTAGLARDEESARAGGDYGPAAIRARWPSLGRAFQGTRGGRSPVRWPPALSAGPGLLFPPNTNRHEVLSQATTQPPAYSPAREDQL